MRNRFRWLYILPFIWIAAGIYMFFTSPDMETLVREHGQFTIPDQYPTAVTASLLEENEGASGETILTVYHEENGLSAGQKNAIEEQFSSIGTEIGGFSVEDVVTPFDSGEQEAFLLSEDGTTAMTIITMDMTLNDIPHVRPYLEDAVAVDGVNYYMSGSSIIEDDVIISSEEGLAQTEIITVLFVITILFAVFRSFAAPFVPLLTVGAAYFVTISAVAFLIDLAGFPVSNFSQIFIVAILFGIGTDYCILLLNRFKEELSKGKSRDTAVKDTYKAVGSTVISSALTGFIGFAAIGLADFDLYQSAAGVAIGIVILVAALWIWVPAAMYLFGEKLFWPSKRGLETTQSRFWTKLGRFSVYKPGWTLMILALLLIPAGLFYDQKLSYNSLDEIGSGFDSVYAIDLVSEKFGEGHAFPVNVVIYSEDEWDQPHMLPYVELVSREIIKLDNVEEVRSFTRPEGEQIEEFRIPAIAEELAEALEEMNDGLAEIQEGLEDIEAELSEDDSGPADGADGMEELIEGTAEARDGSRELAAASEETSDGTAASADGISSLNNELSEVQQQLSQMTESGNLPPEVSQSLMPFSAGLNELSAGFTEVENGLRELAAAQDTIADEMGNVEEGLDEIIRGQRDVQTAFTEIQDGFDELAEGTGELAEGTGEVQEGLDEVISFLEEIAERPPHPLEGFFVPEDVFDEGDFDDITGIFTTPNKQVVLFDVILTINPYSNEAMDLVEQIERQAANALKDTPFDNNIVSLGGLPVVNSDLQNISDEDFNRTAMIMLSGIFIVLVILLKSLVMPVYIIASLILTYIASMAFTEFIFVTVAGYAGISWAVPFFGFVMLMALGVDYSIFLMGRFGENVTKMPVKEALISAMTQIGTVVISAAVILAGTFGAMMPSGVLSLVQIGTMVLTGLMLYATVMLPLFIPVMVTIFDDKNWLPFKRPQRDE